MAITISRIKNAYSYGIFNIIKNYIRIGPIKINILRKLPKISKKLGEVIGKKVLIDCGSNIGQGYEELSKYFPKDKYDVIFIEPNPNCMEVIKKKYKGDKFKFIEMAAWVKEEEITFYSSEFSQAGTISNDQYISNNNIDFYGYKVKSFDLTKLIDDIKDEYSVVVLKMDIESAEYDVLEHLIKEKKIDYINLLLVEFHTFMFKGEKKNKYKLRENQIIKSFSKINYLKWL